MATELTGRPLSRARQRAALTPEESTLIVRLGGFVTMRWIAAASVLIASLLANKVFGVHFPLTPIYIIVAIMVGYNLLLYFQTRALRDETSGLPKHGIVVPLRLSLRRILLIPKTSSPLVAKTRAIVNLHILLDLLALISLIHFTGGIENPFIFFFVFHVIIAGILLHYRVAYVVATIAIGLVLLMIGLEFNGIVPHVNLEGFIFANRYEQVTYILGILVALVTCLYASAFMVTLISGELRKRQREVMSLKDRALREKVKELREANLELSRLEQGRKNLLHFLGVVAHDLKAPLSAVQSYLQLMTGGFVGEIPEKPKHMLERSSQRITEQLHLISDLLDISRIESGQIVDEFKELPLLDTVNDSLENVGALAKEKNISLKAEIPKTLPPIMASPIRLQQVITNLLSNAVKFTPENGTVKLRILDRPNDIQVEVMDTGIGIPTEDLTKIFDDFYRGIQPTKEGTGLGLSIAKRVVMAHKGQIWAESPNPENKSGRGSKFTFTLPKNSALDRRDVK